MKSKALFILAGTVVLLFAGLARTAVAPAKTEAPKKEAAKPDTKAAAGSAKSDEPEDKEAQYFTQETLKEMMNMDEFKNSKLWACYLLTTCKMKLEQVSTLISPPNRSKCSSLRFSPTRSSPSPTTLRSSSNS